MSDADEGGMPRRNRLIRNGGWDGRGNTWDVSAVAHAGMVPRGANMGDALIRLAVGGARFRLGVRSE